MYEFPGKERTSEKTPRFVLISQRENNGPTGQREYPSCCLERIKPVFLTFVLKADNRPLTNPFFSFFVMLLKRVFKNDFYILGGV